jgi:hypothetical protein
MEKPQKYSDFIGRSLNLYGPSIATPPKKVHAPARSISVAAPWFEALLWLWGWWLTSGGKLKAIVKKTTVSWKDRLQLVDFPYLGWFTGGLGTICWFVGTIYRSSPTACCWVSVGNCVHLLQSDVTWCIQSQTIPFLKKWVEQEPSLIEHISLLLIF